MILKALYDYYYRNQNSLPAPGRELKQIGFLLVIDQEGNFLRIEDCRTDKKSAAEFLVKQHVSRTSAFAANHLYDNAAYVLGYPAEDEKSQRCFDAFRDSVETLCQAFPQHPDLQALQKFYARGREEILQAVNADELWEDVANNLGKKYSTFSFRIQGDPQILAEKDELMGHTEEASIKGATQWCLVSGQQGEIVKTTSATMIPGSQATAKLVAFQVKSGYDSYGKEQGDNAPISQEAEFAYTTALNSLLDAKSRNKFLVGNRTFVFWASEKDEASRQAEESVFNLFGFANEATQDSTAVRKVFESIYSGQIKTSLTDRFYMLALEPNSARIAVVYWAETPLKDFAKQILCHFEDMEITVPAQGKPLNVGLHALVSSVSPTGKTGDAPPNLPEAVMKSIFQGMPYPYTLYAGCLRRIQAEQTVGQTRAAILKGYLNRINHTQKIHAMLDKDNNNLGYLCGRLFAVADKMQEEAGAPRSIKDRFLSSACATPAMVFPTILKLSAYHAEKLSVGRNIDFERIKQEILDKVPADGLPKQLDLQDQGRFFVGYYHQRQNLFTKKNKTETEENN